MARRCLGAPDQRVAGGSAGDADRLDDHEVGLRRYADVSAREAAAVVLAPVARGDSSDVRAMAVRIRAREARAYFQRGIDVVRRIDAALLEECRGRRASAGESRGLVPE